MVNLGPSILFNYFELVFKLFFSARKVVECAFGYMRSHWKLFANMMEMTPPHAATMTYVGAMLCNLLIKKSPPDFTSHIDSAEDFVDMNYYDAGMLPPHQAQDIRNNFKAYFNSRYGRKHWQFALATAGNEKTN